MLKNLESSLIPDTTSSVMRDLLLTSELPLFHGIVQEEINQYGVDFSIRMVFQNLSSNQFNTPYTAAYQPVSSLVVTLTRKTHLLTGSPRYARSLFPFSVVPHDPIVDYTKDSLRLREVEGFYSLQT